jgi:hypothetical protein
MVSSNLRKEFHVDRAFMRIVGYSFLVLAAFFNFQSPCPLPLLAFVLN